MTSEEGDEESGRKSDVEREGRKMELKASNFQGRHGGTAGAACSLRHGGGGVKDGCLTRNGPHFRGRRDARRQKHRQHRINHNLSQIRLHYGGRGALPSAHRENGTGGIL